MSAIEGDSVTSHFFSHRSLRQPAIDRLIASGVPPLALGLPDVLSTARVIFEDDGRFEFAADAQDDDTAQAVLILVRDEAGEPCDIAAWLPRGDRLATWLGRAWALGEQTTFATRLDDDPALRVFRSPLDWLRNSRRGLVLLNSTVARWRLADAGPLLAESIQHGQALRSQLALPHPIIVVTAQRAAA